MGFRMRKSFKIAPGVKVNVGTKSTGISFGTKGLRYSVNSKAGGRITASIPGTGISYSTSTNSRKNKSSAYSRNAELKRLEKEQAKMEQLEKNRLEVELFENKIDMLKSIHKECDDFVDWNNVSNTPEPFIKGQKGPKESEALNQLNNYKPSITDKLFGKKDKKIAELENKVAIAKNEDLNDYNEWQNLVNLARNIQNGDIDAYFTVIDEFKPLDDLLEFGSGFEFFVKDANWMEIDFEVNGENVLPKQTKSLTKTGKVSTKNMTKTMYYDIHQDYVCSTTLRIARDMFALLPLDYVIINAKDKKLDTATGLIKEDFILSVKIDKSILNKLNLDLIDPSDSMSNFICNMDFKKTQGLQPVKPLIRR